MQRYTCPVCGFLGLDEPPWDETGCPSYDICPCCGCEFGYDDETIEARMQYLKEWIKRGALWFNPELKPDDWDLSKQLSKIGLKLDDFI